MKSLLFIVALMALRLYKANGFIVRMMCNVSIVYVLSFSTLMKLFIIICVSLFELLFDELFRICWIALARTAAVDLHVLCLTFYRNV